MDFTTFIFLAVLAYFVHVISPNKYVGYFAFIAFLIANQFAWRPLHVATRLVQFGSQPDVTYSDFFGFAPYWESWTWFTVYWLAFCGLLAVASILLWPRGRERAWKLRFRDAGLRFTVPLRVLACAVLAVFLGTGAWIYYNTKVLNTILSEDDRDRLAADYEKTYKKYDKLPQPRVIDLKYAIDLYPERRAATMHADTTIQNKADKPIAVLYMNDPGPDFQTEVQIDGARLKQDDRRLHFQTY
jgi:ABC-2 type transport system permease protein